MCGIAGAVFWTHKADEPRPVDVVERMVEALAHRGPDGRGLSSCDRVAFPDRGPAVALGHTRLAIIDLSERGAQPMASPRVPVWITFNGEIYNFREVRAQLEQNGRSFVSDSDSEVILQGYEVWGDAILERLRGMFALAIWDGGRNRLLLARDRLGIKPVYVYQDDRRLLFASEIRALLATGIVPRRLDQRSVESYLSHQTVPPPRTLVHGVRMLPPGHVATALSEQPSFAERKYWDLLDNAMATDASDAATVRARTRRLLEESTALHLVSDVPVGIFLSGGIDSSAIVALTRRAGVTPKTFSVALPGTAHDEAVHARAIARRFDADHTEVALTVEDFREGLPAALASVDHPSGDGLNTFVVSRAARAHGLKVALSGLGGDELFGGYPSFRRLSTLAAYAPVLRHSPSAVRGIAAAAVRSLGRGSVSASKAAAVLETDGTIPQAFPVLRQLFSPAQRRDLLGVRAGAEEALPDSYERLLQHAAAAHPGVDPLTFVAYAEARTYMHDVLLRDTDQMSMAHALEVRVPFLDHVLAEFVMGLEDRAKFDANRPKALLVDSLGDDLPADIVNRPKQGFVLPFDSWMKGELREFCEHHLGPDGLGARGLFQSSALKTLWQGFVSGKRSVTWSRPWALVALSSWIEHLDLLVS